MANCLNCGRKLGCSCQRRTASDGKSVCASCITNYEKIIIILNKIPNINTKKSTTQIEPTLINVQTSNIKYDNE